MRQRQDEPFADSVDALPEWIRCRNVRQHRRQIAKAKDAYYKVLQTVSDGWHEGRNDVKPFIRYMLQVILSCYVEFESRADVIGGADHSAYDVVLAYVKSKVGRFRGTDAIEACRPSDVPPFWLA